MTSPVRERWPDRIRTRSTFAHLLRRARVMIRGRDRCGDLAIDSPLTLLPDRLVQHHAGCRFERSKMNAPIARSATECGASVDSMSHVLCSLDERYTNGCLWCRQNVRRRTCAGPSAATWHNDVPTHRLSMCASECASAYKLPRSGRNSGATIGCGNVAILLTTCTIHDMANSMRIRTRIPVGVRFTDVAPASDCTVVLVRVNTLRYAPRRRIRSRGVDPHSARPKAGICRSDSSCPRRLLTTGRAAVWSDA
jgi:hypothetical protein